MKKMWEKAVLLVLCALLLCGCAAGAKEPENMDMLYGTWSKTKDDMTTTYIFYEDGTYYEHVETTGEFAVSMTDEGTYTFDGEEIEMTSGEFETSFGYKVTFEGNDMVWDNGSAVIIYTKQD